MDREGMKKKSCGFFFFETNYSFYLFICLSINLVFGFRVLIDVIRLSNHQPPVVAVVVFVVPVIVVPVIVVSVVVVSVVVVSVVLQKNPK